MQLGRTQGITVGFCRCHLRDGAGWLKDKDKQRVADFWRDCFSDLTFAADTAGERDKTVNLMGAFVLCLLEINNRNEAVHCSTT